MRDLRKISSPNFKLPEVPNSSITESSYDNNRSLFSILAETRKQKMEIHEVNSIEQFTMLRDYWNDTLKRSKHDSPFLTWEHIAVSVNNLKKNQKLRVLYISSSDRIIAIAPLRQTFHVFAGCIKYSVVEPLDYGPATDYNGFILAEKGTTCLRLFLAFLYGQRDWDFLRINDVPETSPLIKMLIKNNGLFPKFKIDKGAICPYFGFPDSMDCFLKGLSRNYRKNYAKRLRKLSSHHGNVELKEYHEIYSLEQGMEVFFDLHQERWISMGQKGAFCSNEIRKIFLERATLFAKKGWLGLYFLTVDDKTVAVKYCLRYNKKIYGCLSGFDPSYSEYGIGKTILMKVVERGIQQGFKEYDFMKGDENYKFKLADGFRRNATINFVNLKFTSQLLAVVLSAEKRLGVKKLIVKVSRLSKKIRVI